MIVDVPSVLIYPSVKTPLILFTRNTGVETKPIVDTLRVFVLIFANCAIDVGLAVATLPPPPPRVPRFRIELEPTKLRALYEPARAFIRGVCIPFWSIKVDGLPGAPGHPKLPDGLDAAKFPFTLTVERKRVEGN
jgi:hypothetical protein